MNAQPNSPGGGRRAGRASGWLLLISGLLLGWTSVVAEARPLQVMLLGDELTALRDGGWGFREALWRRLLTAGLDVDFVGTQHDNRPPEGWWPQVDGTPFDPDHEGHAGWRIDHVLNGYDDQPGLEDWLDSYTPDVAVVLLGRQDALQGHLDEWSQREMREVIELLRKDNDRVAIVIASPPPADPESDEALRSLAETYRELAIRENTVQSPVRFVDLYHSFEPHEIRLDQEDNYVPTDAGYAIIAERLASALALLDEAHLTPTRKTSAQVWGSVVVVPAGAAVIFFLLARSQLRREREASHGLTSPPASAKMPLQRFTHRTRASRVSPPAEQAVGDNDGEPLQFPG